MLTNLYGINYSFHLEHSYVMPALLRRFHEAKLQWNSFVNAWGTGKPIAEFLSVDEMAAASIFL